MSRSPPPSQPEGSADAQRLDKWLWASRLYKTRSLAAEDIDKGRVQVNGQAAKPARTLRPGDRIAIRRADTAQEVLVKALSAQRGPAPVARLLYEETPASLAAAAAAALARQQGTEPARTLEQGRPTKRDRRQLVQWQRWSAHLD